MREYVDKIKVLDLIAEQRKSYDDDRRLATDLAELDMLCGADNALVAMEDAISDLELADVPLDDDAELRAQVIAGIPTNELRELVIAYRAGRVIVKPERMASTCGTCCMFSPKPGRCGGYCTEPGRVAKGKNLTKYWTTPGCKKYTQKGGATNG